MTPTLLSITARTTNYNKDGNKTSLDFQCHQLTCVFWYNVQKRRPGYLRPSQCPHIWRPGCPETRTFVHPPGRHIRPRPTLTPPECPGRHLKTPWKKMPPQRASDARLLIFLVGASLNKLFNILASCRWSIIWDTTTPPSISLLLMTLDLFY